MDYSSDRPIDSKEEDAFKRWPFAQRIAHTLATRADPGSLVIGLYGPWGDGKTSTLRLMRRSLAAQPNVVTVEFNPWLFGSDEQLLRGFFATLAASVDSSIRTEKERVGELLDKYGSLLSAALPGLGGAAQNLGKALSTLELGELRKRLEGLLHQAGKRIVVLIDDIDRLNRREIQSIFKLVKLSASFDYTSYVLAFDDQIVAAALGEGYGAGDSSAGRSFLEKIIQVPLHLPHPISLRSAL
jgi:predicted KAP-like P-loop ATPase